MKIRIIAIMLLFCSSFLSAQEPSDPFQSTGDYQTASPFGNYDNFDSINLPNGGVRIVLPPFASRSAFGHTSTYKWIYSSKIWNVGSICGGGGCNPASSILKTNMNTVGWQDSRGWSSHSDQWTQCPDQEPIRVLANYVITDEDGASHNLPLYQLEFDNGPLSSCFQPNQETGFTSSLHHAFICGISTPDGRGTTSACAGTIPFNENTYSADRHQWKATHGADGVQFVNITREPAPLHVITSVQTLDAAGTWKTWTATYTNWSTSRLLQTLVLPTSPSRQYTFNYLASGELEKVTLPNGGYIRYEYLWITNSAYSADRMAKAGANWVTKRAVSADGTAGSEKIWNYSYSRIDPTDPRSPLTVTVTKPDSSTEKHYFSVGTPINSERDYALDKVEFYAAPSDGGALLKSVDYVNTCERVPSVGIMRTSGSLKGGVEWEWTCRSPESTTTIFGAGGQSQKQTARNTFEPFSWTSLAPGSGLISTSTGNVTKAEETDWYTGTPNPLPFARITRTKFLLGKPEFSWVSSGTQIFSLSQNVYHTGAPAPPPPSGTGAIERDLVQAKKGLFDLPLTDSGSDTTPPTVSNWISTSLLYNTNGQITSITDPRGKVKTFEYTQCSGAYVTAVNYPITGLREEKDWNCHLGRVTAHRDMNSSPTTFEFNDPLNRLTRIDRPGGGYERFVYASDMSFMETFKRQKSATEIASKTYFDGLGRPRQTEQVATGGNILVDTFYDGLGRVWKVSNAYISGGSADGHTETKYDGLGRVVMVIPPDGTASTNRIVTEYDRNITTTTDQAGKPRRTYTNAFGQITQVDEPGDAQ